jgi:Golgi nucleoside diphosphatase
MYNVDNNNCEDRDNHDRNHNNRGSHNDHGDHNNHDDFDDEELQLLTRKEFHYTMKLIDDKINSLYRLSKFMGTEQQ